MLLRKSSKPAVSKPSGGPHRKPRPDLYTLLLSLALVALILGCLCFYFLMGTYDFKFKGGPTVTIRSGEWRVESGEYVTPGVVAFASPIPPPLPSPLAPRPSSLAPRP